jgi:membrane protein implicated in regulation of membrane protease activity
VPVYFWIVAAVVLAAAEIFTQTFVLLMFAVGALAAAGVGAVGGNFGLQLFSFLVVTVASLFVVRPVIKRFMHASAEPSAMGVEAIEGSSAVVLERVDQDHGLIKIDGELWTARPYESAQVFEPGDRVRVIEIRGATALVWKE